MWLRDSSKAAFRHLLRDRRGVTAVEFGLIGLIFFMLMLGTVDLARIQFTQQSLRDAAAEAARAALINLNQALALNPTAPPACPTGAALKNAVTTPTNLTPFLNPGSLTIAAVCGTDASGTRTVTVTATYPFAFILPFLASVAPANLSPLTNSAALSY